MKFYIGIDPGQNTGIALWNGKEIQFMKSMSFWDAIDLLDHYAETIPEATIVIENPGLNKPVFHRKVGKKQLQRIAQNVGMNKRDASLLIEYCKMKGFNIREVKPTTEKWDRKDLKMYTGITKRTNEHVRDAVKLVYGH